MGHGWGDSGWVGEEEGIETVGGGGGRWRQWVGGGGGR